MSQLRDNSQCLSHSNCPTQWRFKNLIGLDKIRENEVEHDRNFGKAIHEGLAHWFRSWNSASSLKKFQEGYTVQLNESDLAKTQENGTTLLEKYFERYASDQQKYEILAVEERIDFKVGGRDYCVKCDAVVRDRKYGQVFSLEHKTTKKSLNYQYWDKYDPNSQMCSQTAGVKSKYGECAGVIVDAMAFGYRQKAYKGEPAGFHAKFERLEKNVNDSQLAQWEKSTVKVLEDIERDVELDSFSMNTDACVWCSYKEICRAAWSYPEDKDLILLNYQINPNPHDYLNVEVEV